VSDAHAHAHGHAQGRRAEARSLLLALGLTLGIMLIEFVGGVLSHSLALRADAGHMLTDASTLLLTLVALWLAGRPADDRRTFGYYRLEILAAAVNGMALAAIAVLVLISAWQRLKMHVAVDSHTMLIAATAGLLANLGGYALLSRHEHHSLNIRAARWHLLGDILSSLGVVTAAVAISLTGLTVLDPILSVGIALLIVYGAARLLAEAVDILLEAVPRHLDLSEILVALQKADGVREVHDLHLWTISSGRYALSAHLVVQGGDIRRCDSILSAVKSDLERSFGIAHTTLQIETDAYRHAEEVH